MKVIVRQRYFLKNDKAKIKLGDQIHNFETRINKVNEYALENQFELNIPFKLTGNTSIDFRNVNNYVKSSNEYHQYEKMVYIEIYMIFYEMTEDENGEKRAIEKRLEELIICNTYIKYAE